MVKIVLLSRLQTKTLVFCVLFSLITTSETTAQFTQDNQTNTATQDSVISDTSSVKRNTFKEVFRGKPGRAALYSLVIPGGGQIYNRKWLKLPLSYAVEGGALAWLLYNNQRYRILDDLLDEFRNGRTEPFGRLTSARDVLPERNRYRKSTEYAWVFMILARLYNVFDAYVDRQLMDFDISEDLSIQTFPPLQIGQVPTVGLAYQF